MQSKATTVSQYLNELPEDRKTTFLKLRETILSNLPDKFEECMNYGMIGYVVPHSIFPEGYYCDPKLPLPFLALANQKNSINFYHMGLYADSKLLNWFQSEYAKVCKSKLDMGKSCIRFKNLDDIPYELIGELVRKMSANEWIFLYEKNIKR
ncbi:DUF1801 domain-containing protein [bacterium]|nr:MAG: DUF1801 domain-containing protein [bacterium]